MSLKQRSKSGLFLLELLLNLLLFCVLCGCTLLFFLKSHHLSENATLLHNAVQITSSLAGIYETDADGLHTITEIYPQAIVQEDRITIYYDKEYHPCTQDNAYFHVVITKNNDTANSADIHLYNQKEELFYSIRACKFIPSTPETLKEVAGL